MDRATIPTQEALSLMVAGLRIPPTTAVAMTSAIVDTLEVTDSDGLKSMGSETIVFVAESLEPKPPAITINVVRKWAQYFCEELEIPVKKDLTHVPARKGKVKFGDKSTLSDSDDDGWDGLSEKSTIDPSSKIGQMMAKDTDATGMTPGQNLAFSASVHAGFMVGPEVVDGG